MTDEVPDAIMIEVRRAVLAGWLRLEVTFQDLWHAEWALWQLGTAAESLAPEELRTSLHNRAAALADRYRDSS